MPSGESIPEDLDGPVRNQAVLAQKMHRNVTKIDNNVETKLRILKEYNNIIKELDSILEHRLWKNQRALRKEKQN